MTHFIADYTNIDIIDVNNLWLTFINVYHSLKRRRKINGERNSWHISILTIKYS